MIHNVLIVFGQEKASTPDTSDLDSNFYLHGKKKNISEWGGKKKNPVILGGGQEICIQGGFCATERGVPHVLVGTITKAFFSLWPQSRELVTVQHLTGLIPTNSEFKRRNNLEREREKNHQGPIRSSAAVSSWRPWRPGWAVFWQCNAA